MLTPDPVARSTYSYSGANLIALLHADPSDNVLREYDWTYQDGRIAKEETADCPYYTVDRDFVYDDEGQLTEVGGIKPAEYHYDATGNRTSVVTGSGWNTDSYTYTVDAFNRVTAVYTIVGHKADFYEYDAEGNRTVKYHWYDSVDWDGEVDPGETSNRVEYTWDNRNRLTCVTFKDSGGIVTKTVTFAYDYLNRWVATEVDTDPATAGGETSEYFVYGQATLPDEVAPWDRAATDARDIG